ncbi:hypothetical protein AGMMS49592_5420 [Endomicrobiia bacterium]|nr:hypothetical protein AGMMS49592_5420 [Endomicrobiia bacterium]
MWLNEFTFYSQILQTNKLDLNLIKSKLLIFVRSHTGLLSNKDKRTITL